MQELWKHSSFLMGIDMYLQDLKDIPDYNLDPPEDEYELSKEEKQELYDNYLEELYERDVINYNGPYGEADIKWY